MNKLIAILCVVLVTPTVAAQKSTIVRTARPVGKVAPTIEKKADDVLTPKEERKFRQAIMVLGNSTDTRRLSRATELLREGFPRTRNLISEASKKGSMRARCYAVKLLGEIGEEEDLDTLSRALRDGAPAVRMAAVMAIRKLGPEGGEALRKHLRRETEPNIRKMLVKTFQRWGDREAIFFLVEHLSLEKHPAVRRFTVIALHILSGEKYGDNLLAWQRYVKKIRKREQDERARDYATRIQKAQARK